MIDEAFDTEFEARLRITLDEMIPKLVASSAVAEERGPVAPAEVTVARRAAPVRRSRRLVAAMLAVAATVVGLIVIAGRDTDEVTPGDDSAAVDAVPPTWYELIQPSLPERFPYVALTLATDAQLFFVAVSPTDGKTLEIQLSSGGYSVEPTTTIDATGEWAQTAQGWSVRTPAGLFVSVTCDLGVGGRSYVGPENSCDKTSGLAAFTEDEIRAVANALATSLTPSIFDRNLGVPVGDSIDTTAATALISAAVPGQPVAETNMGNGSDFIYNVGLQGEAPFDTLVATDTPAAPTSVRLLHGLYPSATVTGEVEVISAIYDDAAVVWMLGSGGVAVRIGTTDPSPASVARLAQLARDLLNLDPKATQVGPTPTTNSVPTTATSDCTRCVNAADATALELTTAPEGYALVGQVVRPAGGGDVQSAVFVQHDQQGSVTSKVIARFGQVSLMGLDGASQPGFWNSPLTPPANLTTATSGNIVIEESSRLIHVQYNLGDLGNLTLETYHLDASTDLVASQQMHQIAGALQLTASAKIAVVGALPDNWQLAVAGTEPEITLEDRFQAFEVDVPLGGNKIIVDNFTTSDPDFLYWRMEDTLEPIDIRGHLGNVSTHQYPPTDPNAPPPANAAESTTLIWQEEPGHWVILSADDMTTEQLRALADQLTPTNRTHWEPPGQSPTTTTTG